MRRSVGKQPAPLLWLLFPCPWRNRDLELAIDNPATQYFKRLLVLLSIWRVR